MRFREPGIWVILVLYGFMPVTPCYHHDYYHCYSAMIMQIMQLLFLRLLFWFLFAYFVEGTQL